MDDALRQRFVMANERLERRRAELGIVPRAQRVSARNAQKPAPAADPEDPFAPGFAAVIGRIPRLTPEQEAEEKAREQAAAERAEQRRKDDARRYRAKRVEALKLPITTADETALIDGTVQQTKMVAIVRNWLDSDRPWLTLCGTVGRGKTMAAAWAAFERGGQYVPARELERLFAARYGAELEAQEKLMSARFLVIDDIGRERDVEGMTTALLELLDQRRKNERRTIAISNLSKPEFLKRYQDARLHSRLSESAVWGTDTGADMRKREG